MGAESPRQWRFGSVHDALDQALRDREFLCGELAWFQRLGQIPAFRADVPRGRAFLAKVIRGKGAHVERRVIFWRGDRIEDPVSRRPTEGTAAFHPEPLLLPGKVYTGPTSSSQLASSGATTAMSEVQNRVRAVRESAGLLQQDLAAHLGISRQALSAIESGRRVPGTALALRIARVLGHPVDALFSLTQPGPLVATLAPSALATPAHRVVLGCVGGRLVAHKLLPDARIAADGLVTADHGDGTCAVEPLHPDPGPLHANLLVGGCAPLLGALTHRVQHDRARATWINAGSMATLGMLEGGLLHVAGIHLGDRRDNAAAVRQRFHGRRMLLVNLTTWRQGLLVRPGNPDGIHSGADLLRPGLQVAQRDAGTAAHRLLRKLVADAGCPDAPLHGPSALAHMDVARLVAFGVAHTGISIEPVANLLGLDFVPLTHEHFDLVIPADLAEEPRVARLLDALASRDFQHDVASVRGYGRSQVGDVATLAAA